MQQAAAGTRLTAYMSNFKLNCVHCFHRTYSNTKAPVLKDKGGLSWWRTHRIEWRRKKHERRKTGKQMDSHPSAPYSQFRWNHPQKEDDQKAEEGNSSDLSAAGTADLSVFSLIAAQRSDRAFIVADSAADSGNRRTAAPDPSASPGRGRSGFHRSAVLNGKAQAEPLFSTVTGAVFLII